MTNQNEQFSINTFTDTTKKACTCSAVSIILIILFVISPLSNFFLTSVFMKIITTIMLTYTLYLNWQQSEYLRNSKQFKLNSEINSQLNINIWCSYIFTFLIGLLIIFVIKSFF